jgi:hypothetical protein
MKKKLKYSAFLILSLVMATTTFAGLDELEKEINPNLEELDLYGIEINKDSHEIFKKISKLPLKKLRLGFHFANIRRLENIPNISLSDLEPLKNTLEFLEIDDSLIHCKEYNVDTFEILKENILPTIGKFTKLQVLRVSTNSLEEDSMLDLRDLQDLVELKLMAGHLINGKSFQHLKFQN